MLLPGHRKAILETSMSFEEIQQLAQEETGRPIHGDEVFSSVVDSLEFYSFLAALQNCTNRDYEAGNFIGKTLKEIHKTL